ncbi:MAG TPA: CdaR family protein, partial [Synergistaceae bacterium]|nr:CdaR family protein [Synergistaceae bacterium]
VADPRKVSVSLKIIPRRGEKTLSEVALKVKGKSIYPQWEVFPRSVTVYVEGPVMLLDSLDSSSVEAFVDVTNLVSRKISVPIRVSLGAKELRVIGTAPENATVYAKIDD